MLTAENSAMLQPFLVCASKIYWRSVRPFMRQSLFSRIASLINCSMHPSSVFLSARKTPPFKNLCLFKFFHFSGCTEEKLRYTFVVLKGEKTSSQDACHFLGLFKRPFFFTEHDTVSSVKAGYYPHYLYIKKNLMILFYGYYLSKLKHVPTFINSGTISIRNRPIPVNRKEDFHYAF